MKNRFCEIMGVEKPVMLAPMIYVCDADLTAAVCNAGGLGMLGMKLYLMLILSFLLQDFVQNW